MKTILRRLQNVRRRVVRALQFDHHAYWRARPIRLGTVLYESFAGNGMLCNPEAIFRHLVRQPDFASFQHIWVLTRLRSYTRTIEEFCNSPNVHFVRYRSAAYFRALATSEFLVNNATFPPEFSKRPGQVYLNTWHGTPLKRMGFDMPSGALESANTLRNFVSADYLLAGNQFMAEQMYESAYKLGNIYRGQIIEEGYPRIDRQRLDPGQFIAARLRLEQAGLELQGRDIVLYAPTWKGESFARPDNDVDTLQRVVDSLQQELGNRYVVLLKTHQVVHALARSNLGLRRILVPNDLPTNVVLGAVSALVTDYSSILFDFLATGRPIVFYTPDMTDYADTRGVYFPASEWPGPVCTTVSDVARNLEDLLGRIRPMASERYMSWREEFTPHEDGAVAGRVVDIVFRGRRRGYRVRPAHQDGRRRVLLYLGGMRSNGITSSALTLLNALDHNSVDLSVIHARSRKVQQRANQARIHPAVRRFLRVGGMNGSKLAHVKRKIAARRGRNDPLRARSDQQSLWGQEWTRCFGDVQFDDVIDFSGYSPFWATLLLHSPAATRSIWLHNDMAAEVHRDARRGQSMRRSLPAVFALYREFDHLVSVSPLLNALNLSRLADFAPAERFVTVRNLINPERVLHLAGTDLRELENHPHDPRTDDMLVPQWAEALRHEDKTTWFVTVARLSAEKNHQRLIRAFAALHTEYADIRLLIVGSGPTHARLQHDIDKLHLNDAIYLTGAYANPFAIMAAADCFVLSSDYEGQPMVLLEAAVLELPIISVDFASVHDALPNNSIHIVAQTDTALTAGMRAYLTGDVSPSTINIVEYTRDVLHEFSLVVAADQTRGNRMPTDHDS